MFLNSHSGGRRTQSLLSSGWSCHTHQCRDSWASDYDEQILCHEWPANLRRVTWGSSEQLAPVIALSWIARQKGRPGMLERRNRCTCYLGSQPCPSIGTLSRWGDRQRRKLIVGSMPRQFSPTASYRAWRELWAVRAYHHPYDLPHLDLANPHQFAHHLLSICRMASHGRFPSDQSSSQSCAP